MKIYQLGALTISDNGLKSTREEIIAEFIDLMQKYVEASKEVYESSYYTNKQKLSVIEYFYERFCGLSDFLRKILGVDVRMADGMSYTQKMYNHFRFWKMILKAKTKKEKKVEEI